MAVRFYTSLIAAKLVHRIIKVLGKTSGTSFAGNLALKICPDFLGYCGRYVTGKTVAVTGTNGKSTTSGLIANMLERANRSVIHNLEGANMLSGVANVFALSVRPFKRYDNAVIESDEAYLRKLYKYMPTDYLVVTNLFRDQLDRYGELNTTAEYIKEAIVKNDSVRLILNADDPLVSGFNINGNAVYYGIEKIDNFCNQKFENNSPCEIFNCRCGSELKYTDRFFSHEGHYYCENCGYVRPKCDYAAKVVLYDEYSEINLNVNGKECIFRVNMSGLYNVYNALAAISYGFEAGLSEDEISEGISGYSGIFGRSESRIMYGNKVLVQLIKNPTGASEVLKTVDLTSNIVIAINDNYADGRDISWLWDSDFEILSKSHKAIMVSGSRAEDMALRLKYAGVSDIIIEHDIKRAVNRAARRGKTTVLPTYTALLEIKGKK